jgi:hypothetical protein
MGTRFLFVLAVGAILVETGCSLTSTATPAPSPPNPSPTTLFQDGFDTYPLGTWQEGHNYGNWHVVYNGYGEVSIVADHGGHVLDEQPKPGNASLVVSREAFGDLQLTVKAETLEQLLGSAADHWQVAWVFWHYTDQCHFYYFYLGTTEWELGKEFQSTSGACIPSPKGNQVQRYLGTGSNGPKLHLGRYSTLTIDQQGAEIHVSIDGQVVYACKDTYHPYLNGKIGLYNESAHVRFDRVTVSANNAEPSPSSTVCQGAETERGY